ncbi:MAG: hypothetical protein FJ044_03645 [Candidatus Cloacimonetes bacterium]|nr:hypothetical protein [Candidatus Cloacimonadota bacterium]
MNEEIQSGKEPQAPTREVLRMSEISADFHVIHFGFDEKVGGGDKDASLSIQKTVEYAVRFIPADKSIVIGGHPADSDRNELGKSIYPDDLDMNQKHLKFLQRQKAAIEEARAVACEKYNCEGPRILFGIEADMKIDEAGNVNIVPPPEILAEAGLDVITVSFHGSENIKGWPSEKVAEKLAEGFEYILSREANGKPLVNRLGHPFSELRKIYNWDKSRFQELMDLAKERKVAIEINASKDSDEGVLRFLVENENYLDFGSDHHAFRYWLKESVPAELELTNEERELLDLLARRNKFNRREKILWNGSSYHPSLKGLLQNVSEEEREGVSERIWQLYKHRGVLEKTEGDLVTEKVPEEARNKKLEELFVREREDIIGKLASEDEELQGWLRRELTFLYTIFPVELEWARRYDKEKDERYKARFTELEDKIAEVQISFSDTKALIQKLHQAKMKVGIPPRLFVSTWPREKQDAFLRKELT